MNDPYDVQPATHDAKALRDWTRANTKARAANLADTTTRRRKCTRTAEPGITVCQSCRMSAVRRGKKRKEKK